MQGQNGNQIRQGNQQAQMGPLDMLNQTVLILNHNLSLLRMMIEQIIAAQLQKPQGTLIPHGEKLREYESANIALPR